jgi:anti-sigma B factor antagonist
MMWLHFFPDLPDLPAHSPAGSPGMQVVIEVDVTQDRAVLTVTGDLDLITRPVLAERLSAVLATSPRWLVLDLAQASFMDCGSARMVACAGRFLPAGGRLIIRHPSPVVRRVLELTGCGAGCQIEE